MNARVEAPSVYAPTTTPASLMPPIFPFTPSGISAEPSQVTSSPLAARPATTPLSFTARAQLWPTAESLPSPKSCMAPSP